MTHTTGALQQAAADLAQGLLTREDAEPDRPFTILTHPQGSSLVARREALRPVYTALVERVGEPTLLGGTERGPSVRWSTRERTLLLSGDHSAARLSVHQGDSLVRREFWDFDSDRLPYIWQLDRQGPGDTPGWTFTGHRAAFDWAEAEERLAGMLASWAEHVPVQAPGDWVGFSVWAARDWQQHTMVVSFTPWETGQEFHVGINDRDHEQTPERATEMRARGWQYLDEHRWWRTRLPETDPTAPTTLARVVLADLRARGTTCPPEVHAWDISIGDRGDLWTPGLGFEIHPRRAEADF